MEEYRLFFELIQISLGKRSAFTDTPSPEDWQALFEEAQRQTLAGVLYPALDRVPEEQRPPRSVLFNWHATKEQIEKRNEQVNKDAVWVTERFQKVGFRSAILKGQGNALLYPQPLLRQSGDIDIWLDGERDNIIKYVLKHFPKQRVQYLEVEFPVRKETVIEVHTAPSILFCPSDNKRLQAFYNKYKEDIFTNTKELGEGMIQVPVPVVNLAFQLSHIYRHLFYEGIGLRQLLDYYYLLLSPKLSRLTKEEEDEVRQVIRQTHMSHFASALMWVLHEVFLLEEDFYIAQPEEKEGKFLLKEIMLAGNFGKYDVRIQHKQSKWGNFWQITGRNWHFLSHYPREVLWNPWYRIKQFLWRKRNGYN